MPALSHPRALITGAAPNFPAPVPNTFVGYDHAAVSQDQRDVA
jgi:hypothetical protein